MAFRYIPLEKIGFGPDSVYREVDVRLSEHPGKYYVSWKDSERALTGMKLRNPDIAYKIIKKVPQFRPKYVLTVPVKNQSTLTDIAETIEAEERHRRQE